MTRPQRGTIRTYDIKRRIDNPFPTESFPTHPRPSVRVRPERGTKNARGAKEMGEQRSVQKAVLRAALRGPIPVAHIVAHVAIADAPAIIGYGQPQVRLQGAKALDRIVATDKMSTAERGRLSTVLRAPCPAGDRCLARLASYLLERLDA